MAPVTTGVGAATPLLMTARCVVVPTMAAFTWARIESHITCLTRAAGSNDLRLSPLTLIGPIRPKKLGTGRTLCHVLDAVGAPFLDSSGPVLTGTVGGSGATIVQRACSLGVVDAVEESASE